MGLTYIVNIISKQTLQIFCLQSRYILWTVKRNVLKNHIRRKALIKKKKYIFFFCLNYVVHYDFVNCLNPTKYAGGNLIKLISLWGENGIKSNPQKLYKNVNERNCAPNANGKKRWKVSSVSHKNMCNKWE